MLRKRLLDLDVDQRYLLLEGVLSPKATDRLVDVLSLVPVPLLFPQLPELLLEQLVMTVRTDAHVELGVRKQLVRTERDEVELADLVNTAYCRFPEVLDRYLALAGGVSVRSHELVQRLCKYVHHSLASGR